MDKNERLTPGPQNAPGQWGKWKGKTCITEGCNKPVSARGFCVTHYNRKRWADGVRPPSTGAVSVHNAHLKHRYGITAEDYDRILAEQNGRCAICRCSNPKTPRRWRRQFVPDHCHDSGRFRSLLCNSCNM